MLVRVEQPLSRGIERFTGITQAMVDNAPPPAEVLPEVAAMLEGRCSSPHSAQFDRRALKQAFERCDLKWPNPLLPLHIALTQRRLARTLPTRSPEYMGQRRGADPVRQDGGEHHEADDCPHLGSEGRNIDAGRIEQRRDPHWAEPASEPGGPRRPHRRQRRPEQEPRRKSAQQQDFFGAERDEAAASLCPGPPRQHGPEQDEDGEVEELADAVLHALAAGIIEAADYWREDHSRGEHREQPVCANKVDGRQHAQRKGDASGEDRGALDRAADVPSRYTEPNPADAESQERANEDLPAQAGRQPVGDRLGGRVCQQRGRQEDNEQAQSVFDALSAVMLSRRGSGTMSSARRPATMLSASTGSVGARIAPTSSDSSSGRFSHHHAIRAPASHISGMPTPSTRASSRHRLET